MNASTSRLGLVASLATGEVMPESLIPLKNANIVWLAHLTWLAVGVIMQTDLILS